MKIVIRNFYLNGACQRYLENNSYITLSDNSGRLLWEPYHNWFTCIDDQYYIIEV